MGDNRAFARIVWRTKDILALQMVNTVNQKFLIYAEPLITIFDNPDSYVRVKKKDSHRDKDNLSYYSGEVWGLVQSDTVTKIKNITIFIGPAESVIEYDEETDELNNVVEVQKYSFPASEINSFVKSIKIMQEQNYEFTHLMMDSEVMVRRGK